MKTLDRQTLFESQGLHRDLVRKSVQGGMVTVGSQGMQFVLQAVSTAVLARLLTPADYGLVGMVTVVVNFAGMFKDAGLSMATVQKEHITHEQISALFWINVLVSAVLSLCVLASSPLVAWFYGKSELIAVTAVLSLSFIISGLTIQHQALLQRHMCFGVLAGIRIASRIVTLVVAVTLAWVGYRYWALIGSSLASALANMLLTFYFCPWIPGRMQKGTGVRKMLEFGGHVSAFNFVNYFSRNADSILIGRTLGADALGLYTRAYQLFMMPVSQIRGPMNEVAMPVLSSLRSEPARYARYYRRLLDIMASLTVPVTIYCAIEADFVVGLLLGPKWLQAVSVFRILAVAGLIQVVAGTRGLVLISHGYSGRYLRWGFFNAILCVTSFVLGVPHGAEGVAIAYTIVNYAILVPSLYYCFSSTAVSVPLFFGALIPPLAIGSVAGAVVLFLRSTWASDSLLYHGVYLGVFVLVYIGLSLCRQSIRETFAAILGGARMEAAIQNDARSKA